MNNSHYYYHRCLSSGTARLDSIQTGDSPLACCGWMSFMPEGSATKTSGGSAPLSSAARLGWLDGDSENRICARQKRYGCSGRCARQPRIACLQFAPEPSVANSLTWGRGAQIVAYNTMPAVRRRQSCPGELKESERRYRPGRQQQCLLRSGWLRAGK